MIKVDQFCCGCSLKTGAIIVGVVYLIMGILYAFMGFVGFSGNIGIGGGQVVIIDSFGSHDVYDLGLASFIMGIVDILIASSLLYGAMERNPTFLLPFLILIPLDNIIAKLSPSSSPSWAMLALVSLDPATHCLILILSLI